MPIPTNVLKTIFAINVVFLLLLGFSAPHIERGSGGYVAALLTLGAIGVMLTLVAVLYVVQRRQEKEFD